MAASVSSSARWAIFAAFLIEALVMTLSGGVGIVAAWALTKVALLFSQVPAGARPHISIVTALMALSLLTLGRAGRRCVAGEAGCSRVPVRSAAS